jgi:hypothetical protein
MANAQANKKAQNYKTLNCNQRRTGNGGWLKPGEHFQFGSMRMRFVTMLDDGHPVMVLRSEFGARFTPYQIRDGQVISIPVNGGFLEFIPKALKFNDRGDTTGLLLDWALITLREVLH